MSKVDDYDKNRLKISEGDDERFHAEFDSIIEAKLMKLDPKWMKEMDAIYRASGMCRWCA